MIKRKGSVVTIGIVLFVFALLALLGWAIISRLFFWP